MDRAELLMPKEMRTGGECEPYVIRTRLGWVARGITREGRGPISHRIHVLTVEESPLDREFKRFLVHGAVRQRRGRVQKVGVV